MCHHVRKREFHGRQHLACSATACDRTENPAGPLRKLAAQEKEMIETALRESAGRVFGPSGAATKLGTSRSTLESKIRSLKISKNSFKDFAETISRRSYL